MTPRPYPPSGRGLWRRVRKCRRPSKRGRRAGPGEGRMPIDRLSPHPAPLPQGRGDVPPACSDPSTAGGRDRFDRGAGAGRIDHRCHDRIEIEPMGQGSSRRWCLPVRSAIAGIFIARRRPLALPLIASPSRTGCCRLRTTDAAQDAAAVDVRLIIIIGIGLVAVVGPGGKHPPLARG